MSQQQRVLILKLTVSQILREYGKRFTQVKERYSDGHNGRCAISVIMSYFGWDGRDEPDSAQTLLAAFDNIKHADIDVDLLIDLNDLGYTFDEIADYLDRIEK
jgi:hypothetical protein